MTRQALPGVILSAELGVNPEHRQLWPKTNIYDISQSGAIFLNIITIFEKEEKKALTTQPLELQSVVTLGM